LPVLLVPAQVLVPCVVWVGRRVYVG
jgi:hypothetical protein